jgi:hypothetical protein
VYQHRFNLKHSRDRQELASRPIGRVESGQSRPAYEEDLIERAEPSHELK